MQQDIRITWDGPFSLKDIGYCEDNENYSFAKGTQLNEYGIDHGVYQVYGCHPIYGNNVLLYIGKTEQQTFAKRISQEAWEYDTDSKNIQFYVGRLFDKKQPSNDVWDRLISLAERILIFVHSPARNSSHILNISKNSDVLKEFENIRVMNYDNYRSLMPEVSGELWVKGFDDYEGVFGSDSLNATSL